MLKSARLARFARSIALALLTMGPAAYAQQSTVADAARRAATGRIQPGDRIAVQVLREEDWNDTIVVNERGEASFAKLGLMRVDSMSISALQDTLRARYSEYLRNPALQINVLRRIAVNGEVENPDIYLVDLSSTLRDVVAQAGGVNENGNRNKVYIVRGGVRTRVANWETQSGTAADLSSGDVIVVGRRSWIAQNGLAALGTAVIVAGFVIQNVKF